MITRHTQDSHNHMYTKDITGVNDDDGVFRWMNVDYRTYTGQLHIHLGHHSTEDITEWIPFRWTLIKSYIYFKISQVVKLKRAHGSSYNVWC